MTNDKPSYTYLLFKKFWEEHKEFLKLQIKYGPLPFSKEIRGSLYDRKRVESENKDKDKDKIKNKREEYYAWLKARFESNPRFNFLNSKISLAWENPHINDKDLTKIREATWVTFNLLIDKCEGSEDWGRVAEVFSVIVHLLCGNKCQLQYNAMSYLFMVLSYDISLQAIYNGLSLLSNDKKDASYNISDYTLINTGAEYYKIPGKFDKDKGVFVKDILTAGTLNTDLRKYRYINPLLPIFVNIYGKNYKGHKSFRSNISNVPNTLVQHRNATIHGAYYITDDFLEKPEAYKNRLAGIIYDYVTIVFYLIEYIDKVNEDYKINPDPYFYGQKEITYDNFVKPASGIIEGMIAQLHAFDNLLQEQKDFNIDDQFEIPKHFSILTSLDEISTKTGIPEEAKTLIPAIVNDPGTLELLFERLKSVQEENNKNFKEDIFAAFKGFIDEYRAQIEVLTSSIQEIQEVVVDLKEGQEDLKEVVGDLKEGQENLKEGQEDLKEVVGDLQKTMQVTQEKQSKDIENIQNTLDDEKTAREIAAKKEAEKKRKEEEERKKEAERIERIKKWIKRDNIYIAADVVIIFIYLSFVFSWLIFYDDILKNRYGNRANQELIMARECEINNDYVNSAIHNKAAFNNTLKAFQVDTNDNGLRNRLIYMYQWGKGTPENHKEALRLVSPIKDSSPKNFGRYLYLKYTVNPSDTLSLFSEIKHKGYNTTDATAKAFLQDSLVKLTEAVIGLSFANNEKERKYLTLIRDFDAAGMYEAKWEMAKFMLRQKQIFVSGKSVHFMPTETFRKLLYIAQKLNYGNAWKELGNIYDIFEINDLAAITYKKAILAGKDELYRDFALSNYELWQEHNDSAYIANYMAYMQKAANRGDSIALMLIDLEIDDINYRDKALLENKAASRFATLIANKLLRNNPSENTMNTILQLLHKNGRDDVSLSYLKAHKAFYEKDYLNYISLMQQAWEDSCLYAYLCLGDYCINIKEYDNARFYYNKVKEAAADDYIQTEAYDRLLNLAILQGDTISLNHNAPNASLIWKLEVGHYKDNPEYMITEFQNLIFSNKHSLNQKGLMAFLIGKAYEKTDNVRGAIDWYTLAANELRQPWAYGVLLPVVRFVEDREAFELFKSIEGYDLSAKEGWSKEEYDMLRYIYAKELPLHEIGDATTGEIHTMVPYALRKWGEYVLKGSPLPDKYKKALLWLARDTDSLYGSTVEADLSEYGLDTNMSTSNCDLEEILNNLMDMVSVRLLPNLHPRCVEF